MRGLLRNFETSNFAMVCWQLYWTLDTGYIVDAAGYLILSSVSTGYSNCTMCAYLFMQQALVYSEIRSS